MRAIQYGEVTRFPRQGLKNLTLEQHEQFLELLLQLIKDKQILDSCREVENEKNC